MKAFAEVARTTERPAAAAATCTNMPAQMPSAATIPARHPCVVLRPTI